MAQSSDDDEPDTNYMLLTSANIGNTAAADSEDSEEQEIVDDVVRSELIQHDNQSYTREQRSRAKKVKALHEYAHMSNSTLKTCSRYRCDCGNATYRSRHNSV
jgi:hypothetical protein